MSAVLSEVRRGQMGSGAVWGKEIESAPKGRVLRKALRNLGESERGWKRAHTEIFRMLAREPSWPKNVEAVNRLVKQASQRAAGLTVDTVRLTGRFEQLGERSAPAAANVSLAVTSLDKAVNALARLSSEEVRLEAGDERMHTARLLRRAAVDQSRLSPRVASIALLISDALLNSPGAEASPERRKALRMGLDLLMDSFVSEEREKQLYRALMEAGWEVTAAFDQNEFAGLVAQVKP